MSPEEFPTADLVLARELVTEVLRTGIAFADVLSSLLDDLPDDAFPGEDPAEVLIEMVSGSCTPTVQAAGAKATKDAVALVAAVRDRAFADLRAAVKLASGA